MKRSVRTVLLLRSTMLPAAACSDRIEPKAVGPASGVVGTARITHAAPGWTHSHSPGRQARAGHDGKPCTTLRFANGPGAVENGLPRANLTRVDTTDADFLQPSLVPLPSETMAARTWHRRDRPLVAPVPGDGRAELYLPRVEPRLRHRPALRSDVAIEVEPS